MLKFIKKIFLNQYFLVLVIISFFCFTLFFDFFKYDYVIPPGDDCLRHMTVAYQINENQQFTIAETNDLAASLTDVPVFHILISIISQITGLAIVTVTQYIVRFVMVFIALGFYFIVRRLFSKTAAILALCFVTLFSYTIQTIFTEGTYLDLFSASFLLPWGLLFLSYFLNKKESAYKYFWLAWIFLSGVFLTHPLTSIGLLFILSVLHGIIIISFIFRKKIFSWKRILLLDLALGVSLLGSWSFYLKGLVDKFVGLAQLIFVFKGDTSAASEELSFIPPSLGLSDVPGWHNYIEFISLFGLVFGILGFLYLLKSKTDIYKKIVISSWLGGLLIASQLSAVQLPIRFARDLYLPVLMLAGIFFVWLFRNIKNNKIILGTAISLLILLFSFSAYNLYQKAHSYNGFVRLQKPDEKAAEWIRQNTEPDDVFLGTPLVAAAEWGSFVTLLTDRKFLDCNYDWIIEEDRDVYCSVIYNTDHPEVIPFYKENNISYVYGGKQFIGPYLWADYINWDHYTVLSDVEWLEPVFDERNSSGRVVIYKVNLP